jgi:hypothetical protein
MGFFTKNVDGRIDDPNAGWNDRAAWAMCGTRTNFHSKGGKGVLAKVPARALIRADGSGQRAAFIISLAISRSLAR